MPRVKIGERWVGDGEPTYFIADISANHDGDLERAKMLIRLAAEAGADAAKFQNFRAPKIASRWGFESQGRALSHQATWKKPVYEVYKDASLPWKWTPVLKEACDKAGIHYFSTPYDFEAVDMLDPYVPCFKIGSGDITWPEMLEKVASKKKPVILSTGASTLEDVKRALKVITRTNKHLVLLQCNTNYTANQENFRFINLKVLETYRKAFPGAVLGLSDHTLGLTTVLGAVALGGRVVEKHFTDDPTREGPDHPFSMTPKMWREMVDRIRELELALGTSTKEVMGNEQETVVIQRRCLRAARDLAIGTTLTKHDLEALRPAPADAVFPYELKSVVGRRLKVDLPAGEYLRKDMLERRS